MLCASVEKARIGTQIERVFFQAEEGVIHG
jgi:hypothetical protein